MNGCYRKVLKYLTYITGTWNKRSKNEAKFEIVKQDIDCLNVAILKVSELNWTGLNYFSVRKLQAVRGHYVK